MKIMKMATMMSRYIWVLLSVLIVPSYGRDITLFDTIIQNDIKSSKYLIIQKNADVTEKNKEGMTYLHLVSDPELALLLIEKGVDINATNRRGDTPLHWAVSKDKISIVELLIDNGADVNVVDNLGNSPLHASVDASDEIMLLLLKSGADVNLKNKAGTVPLLQALLSDRYTHAKYLILAGAIDIPNNDGVKPSVVESLVKKESLKETLIIGLLPFPVISEIFKENYAAALDLIKELEYIDEIDLDGNTALHWAFKVKNYEIAEALILKETSYSEFNNEDKTPIDILQETEDDEFIDYMKDFLQENTDYDKTVYHRIDTDRAVVVFY